ALWAAAPSPNNSTKANATQAQRSICDVDIQSAFRHASFTTCRGSAPRFAGRARQGHLAPASHTYSVGRSCEKNVNALGRGCELCEEGTVYKPMICACVRRTRTRRLLPARRAPRRPVLPRLG